MFIHVLPYLCTFEKQDNDVNESQWRTTRKRREKRIKNISRKSKDDGDNNNTTVHRMNANLPSFHDANTLIEWLERRRVRESGTHRKGRHEQTNKKERERLYVVHDTKCKRKQFCYRIDAANILLFYVLPMPSSTWMSILSLIDNRLLHTTCIPICIDIFFQRQQPTAIATQHHLHFVADNAHRWKKLKRSKTEEINNEFTIF